MSLRANIERMIQRIWCGRKSLGSRSLCQAKSFPANLVNLSVLFWRDFRSPTAGAKKGLSRTTPEQTSLHLPTLYM